MYLDSGRIEDIRKMEHIIRTSADFKERSKARNVIDHIKRQAENETLGKEREKLLESRRQTNNERRYSVSGMKSDTDKLEEKIDKEYSL